ncbi:MAG: 4-hydroxy-3-methylbut-2-enyl diphosphate reductase, partial [Verrucomicrobiota bacterium]|nr:4-hydroxy-3-methylbut-2-enyl diphosphate reductase [Verrucomicrobiota bacterium]
MSTDAPSQPQSKSPKSTKPKRINLRRPDVMEQVKAQVLTHYRSDLVDRLRATGEVTSESARMTIKLAKEFGFCYGVERCIDLAYAALKVFPDKPIYILGEIIHNPEVNDQIRDMGIRFLSGPNKVADIDDLGADDVVIIPAFGTEVATLEKLKAKGCQFVDTTCGDVMSVWKRVRNYAKEEITSIIHGKAYHEETKATSSQATSKNGHYLVVLTLEETDYVCDYIENGGDKNEFLEKFKGAFSEGFDPDQHLKAVGVANQTTMMRNETEEVQRRIKAAIERKFGAAKVDSHFRFFDTICGATQERQDALDVLLQKPMDLLLVIGGYNSSNTAHL